MCESEGLTVILVVSEQLNLRFLLQHQGKFIHSARTATEALRVLRDHLPQVKGIILDEHMPSSRLVETYCRTYAPALRVVSWRIAQRNSPFTIAYEQSMSGVAVAMHAPPEQELRYVYTPQPNRLQA
jgi:hypothetical protein